MSKQDRQGARTPADIERKVSGSVKEVSRTAQDAQKRAETAKQEVENLKHEKISVDRLDIEGKELNIKVAATNIIGSILANQINADGITAKNVDITGKITAEKGKIGNWTLGKVSISYEVLVDGRITTETITVNALTSEWEAVPLKTTENGSVLSYLCKTYLTPFGVYVQYYYDLSDGGYSPTRTARKSWLELIAGQDLGLTS